MSRIVRLTLNGTMPISLGCHMQTATGPRMHIEILGVLASGEYLVKIL